MTRNKNLAVATTSFIFRIISLYEKGTYLKINAEQNISFTDASYMTVNIIDYFGVMKTVKIISLNLCLFFAS